MGRLHTSGSIIKKKRDASSTQKTTKQKSKILPRNVNNNKQKNLPKRIQFDSDLLDIFSNTDDGEKVRRQNLNYVRTRYPEHVKTKKLSKKRNNVNNVNNVNSNMKKKRTITKPKITRMTNTKETRITQNDSLISWKKDKKMLKKWVRHSKKKLRELNDEYTAYMNNYDDEDDFEY